MRRILPAKDALKILYWLQQELKAREKVEVDWAKSCGDIFLIFRYEDHEGWEESLSIKVLSNKEGKDSTIYIHHSLNTTSKVLVVADITDQSVFDLFMEYVEKNNCKQVVDEFAVEFF